MLAPKATDSDALALAIDAIWARSRGVMMSHVDRIGAAATSLLASTLTASERLEAQHAAHRLAGTVGTFGFHAASTLAREIELAFDSPAVEEPANILRIAEHVEALRMALDVNVPRIAPRDVREATSTEAVPLRRAAHVATWLVGADDDRLDALAIPIVASGASVVRMASAPCPAEGAVDLPDLLFLAPSAHAARSEIGDGYAELISQVALWRSRHPKVLTVVLESRELELRGLCDIRTRVAIADSEAIGPVPRAVEAEPLLRFALKRHRERTLATDADAHADVAPALRTVVLLVNDEAAITQRVGSALAPLGSELELLEDPLRIWHILPRVRPDVVVVNLDRFPHDGLVMLRLIRDDVRWHELPIIILADEVLSARVTQSRELGVEDVLSTQVVASQLRRCVARQLARTSATSPTASTAAMLRIAPRAQLLELLEREMDAASRSGLPLCTVLVRMGNAAVGDGETVAGTEFSASLAWFAQLLSHVRRVGETASRVSPDTVLMTWQGVTSGAAKARLCSMLRSAPRGITIASGCIERAALHADARALLRDTERALWRSPPDRPHVEPTDVELGDDVAVPGQIGVALVEDDDALGELLALTIGVAGYDVRRWSDGGEFADAVCGPAPTVSARVILLDINLPTVDGLTLLRRLRASGVLRTSRVIVMSVRSNETEMLQAFAAGAFDFVAKPLSVPVLMHRLQRAMLP